MLRWLLCGIGILFSGAAMAFAPPVPDGAELATLPPYCKVKANHTTGAENMMWSDKFGADNWIHMHHYCYGLNYLINRYYKERTKEDKSFMLSEAVNNFDYVIEHTKPGFILLPEVHYNRGKALRLLGRAPEALSDWLEAIRLNPMYVPGYLTIADYYVELKQRGKALQTVSEGLRYVPASTGLQQRYQELGGKLPFPEPYQRPAEQKAVAEIKAATDAPATENATPDTKETETLKPAESKPAIGMPGNPYCRFCTD